MSALRFTGERLHEEDPLFAIDLQRHRAAYAYAIELAREQSSQRVLDLGCGTGYGTHELAEALPQTFALDRIAPDSRARHPRALFIRADAGELPIRPASFDLVVSFQVIEHLENPAPYLEAITRLLRPEGAAIITTPNLLQSDRENPFHVHEYEAAELAALLAHHFEDVDMLGVGAQAGAKEYYEARLKRIRTIVRLDPLRLRTRLPRSIVDRLFAAFAVIVRRGIQRSDGLPEVQISDFPILPVEPECLDLLAVCRKPRPQG